MKSFLPACAFLVLLAGTNLRAEEGMMEKPTAPSAPEAAAPAKPMTRTEEIMLRFDKNGDGRLDDDEKADAHEMMLQEQMTKGANPAVSRNLDAFQVLALEVFDRNHDGRIDEAERREAFAFVRQDTPAGMREVLIKRFDKNNDGMIDETERKEVQPYMDEHRGELMQEVLLKRFDKNANGQLDPDEKAAIREAFAAAVASGATADAGSFEDNERAAAQKYLQGEGRELLRAELISRFDANKNGRLDPEEQRAAQEYSRGHRAELFRAVLLRAFDKNGDGRLDETERAAAREALPPPSSTSPAIQPPATPASPAVEKPAGDKSDSAPLPK